MLLQNGFNPIGNFGTCFLVVNHLQMTAIVIDVMFFVVGHYTIAIFAHL